MRYDPKAAPFWDKGEHKAREKKAHGLRRLEYVRARLNEVDLELSASAAWDTHDKAHAVKRDLEETRVVLAEASERLRRRYAIDYRRSCVDPDAAACLRTEGHMGDGNRWASLEGHQYT